MAGLCPVMEVNPVNISFESGFSGFSGLQRTSSVQVQWSFVDNYYIPFFSPMRYASARGFKMESLFNNNLPPKPETL